jgi:very-short-patch-repair endonuclease
MSERLRARLPTHHLEQARILRRGMTDAERKLWLRLRGSRLGGFRFRRQHPLPPYALDFYCAAARLAVEIDGGQHSEAGDAVRTRFLSSHGLQVLRFWNDEVLNQTEAVLEAILSALQARPLTPTPLPLGEGLEPEPQP